VLGQDARRRPAVPVPAPVWRTHRRRVRRHRCAVCGAARASSPPPPTAS